MIRQTIAVGLTVGLMATTGAAFAESLRVPSGTKIKVELEEGLNTALTHKGDRIALRVAEDVRMSDTVAIPRGAAVEGLVVQVKGAAALKNGNIRLRIVGVRMPDGSRLQLNAKEIDTNNELQGSKAANVVGRAFAGLALAAGGGFLGRQAGVAVTGKGNSATNRTNVTAARIGLGVGVAQAIVGPPGGRAPFVVLSGATFETRTESALEIPSR